MDEETPPLQQQQDDWLYWDWYTQQRCADEAFYAEEQWTN